MRFFVPTGIVPQCLGSHGTTTPVSPLNVFLCIGEVIRTARDGAADDHRPEMHESNWSLGVRSYERTCGTLVWAAVQYDWLTVVTGNGGGPVHFVMTMGGHAVRFYRGSPESVPERYRQRSFPELIQQQQALELDDNLPLGRSLRIAIENDEDGHPESIYLVEISDAGDATNIFLHPAAGPSHDCVLRQRTTREHRARVGGAGGRSPGGGRHSYRL